MVTDSGKGKIIGGGKNAPCESGQTLEWRYREAVTSSVLVGVQNLDVALTLVG